MFMAAALLLSLTAAPVDVTGKWDGTVTAQREDGTAAEDTVLLMLTQKETTITGTVGGHEQDQHPITAGRIEGNKITLTAKNANSGREYTIELTLDGDQMKGTVVAGNRKAEITARKRKQ
jgi:hypothetical protein